MSDNPLIRVRFLGSLAIVLVIAASLANLVLAPGSFWLNWPWVIGAVALAYATISFVLHLRHADHVDAAWDEQNIAAHRASLIFGYWTTLALFVSLLLAVFAGHLAPEHAFYWMGLTLGAAPALHFVISSLRGRAG